MKSGLFRSFSILFAATIGVIVLSGCPSPSPPADPPTTALDPCIFDVPGGVLAAATSLHISNADAAATIWYTLDGSTPLAGSSPQYSTGIGLSYTRTVKAIATKTGMTASQVASADYHFLWTTRTAMPTARYGACAAAVGTKVYVMGGYDSAASNETLVFDTVANSWTSDDNMPVALYRASALAYGGKVYVFGGYTGAAPSGAIYRFDPSLAPGSRWSASLASLGATRYWASAALVGSMAYVTGGNNGSSLKTTDRVNLAVDPPVVASSAVDDLAAAVQQQGAYAIGGAVYLLGGNPGRDTALKLDPTQTAGSQWSTITPSPVLDYFDMSAGGVVNGIAYSIGGYWTIVYAKNLCRAFDPGDSSVTARTAMPTARYDAASAVVNGTIIVFGGLTDPVGPVSTAVVEQYDPAAEP